MSIVARQTLTRLTSLTEFVANVNVAKMDVDGQDTHRMPKVDAEAYARGDVDMVYRAWLEDMDKRSNGAVRRAAQNATLGYVTHDVRPSVLYNSFLVADERLPHSLARVSAMTPSTHLW